MIFWTIAGWSAFVTLLVISIIRKRRNKKMLTDAVCGSLDKMLEGIKKVQQVVTEEYYHTINIKAHPGQCFGIESREGGTINLVTWNEHQPCPVDRDSLTGQNMILPGYTTYAIEPGTPSGVHHELQPQTAE